MTINVESSNVNCVNGVHVSVSGVAQCKINAETDASLHIACENFLGMPEHRVNEVINQTMEGHQRAIISTMTVEEVFRDREKFSQNVRDCAQPDIAKLGVHILSYTISSVTTSNGYLKALGKPTIALVHRDARIGEAEARRDADIAIASATQAKDEKVFATKLEIEKMKNDRDLIVAANQKEINTEQAIAELAKRMKEAEVNQTLVNEKMQISVIEKTAEARVMDEEVKYQDKHLEATVKLKAETEKYKMEVKANAEKQKEILKSEAVGFKVQAIGDAEAEVIRMKAE